jgi:hypothetical protein
VFNLKFNLKERKMNRITNVKIALLASFFGGIGFISCNKENEVPEITNQRAFLSSDVIQDEDDFGEMVPFFELAKGDTIAKGIYREKPLFTDDIQILFSSQEATSVDHNPLTKASGYSGGIGYIYDLKTSVRTSNDAPATMDGYTKIPVDLNEGAGGKWIYLYYKKTSQVQDGLHKVNVRISSTRNLVANAGCRKLGLAFANGGWTDLNEGAGGKYINIEGGDVKTKVNLGYPYPYPGYYNIRTSVYKEIAVISSSSALRWNSLPGWNILLNDLNSGCGGKYIYLCYQEEAVTL